MASVKEYRPFEGTSLTEIARADRNFICKMMKLDPRDRPTAEELLDDGWSSA